MLLFLPANILLLFIALLALMPALVMGQCSESHRQACSWSRLQLQSLSTRILPPDRYVPDYNGTTLRHVCSLYEDFRECTQSFLSSCSSNVVHELTNLDNTFGLICGDLFEGYLKYRVSCYQRLDSSFQTCSTNQKEALDEIDIRSATYRYQICSLSKDYIQCIYTITALGCSLDAADIYFKLLNQSIGSIFSSAGLICDINHPKDVIPLYTTTPSTTVTSSSSQSSTDNSVKTTGNSDQISGSHSVHTVKGRHVFLFVPCVFILWYSTKRR